MFLKKVLKILNIQQRCKTLIELTFTNFDVRSTYKFSQSLKSDIIDLNFHIFKR